MHTDPLPPPTDAGRAECAAELATFDALTDAAARPTRRALEAAAAVCHRCPVAAVCQDRVAAPALGRTPPRGRGRRGHGDARAAVLALLQGGEEITITAIRERTGLPDTSVRSIAARLHAAGRVRIRRAPHNGAGWPRVYISLTETEEGEL